MFKQPRFLSQEAWTGSNNPVPPPQFHIQPPPASSRSSTLVLEPEVWNTAVDLVITVPTQHWLDAIQHGQRPCPFGATLLMKALWVER